MVCVINLVMPLSKRVDFPFSMKDIRFHSREQTRTVPVRKSLLSSKGVSVHRSKSWVYDDKHLNVSNGIMTGFSKKPHLILMDSKKVPRFVLEYSSPSKGVLLVSNIQRIRNEYLPYYSNKGLWRHSAFNESRVSQGLKKSLGMHPSDALFSEFLFRFRKQIKLGKFVVKIIVEPEKMRNYKGTIDRFFIKSPTTKLDNLYVLSMGKRRVKEILALK